MTGVEVSVIIPTYNRAQYILECIESVLMQTYQNLEVILVDDGSTDHTEQLVRNIDDKRFNYIAIENSGRPATPRNVGLDLARGEFIAFLDSDDI